LGSAAALAFKGSAQTAPEGLPLRNTGLEQFGVTVPDPEAAAKFYGKIFDTQLFEEKDPPPRFYVRLGIAYIAFGGRTDAAPFIDHFCTLTEGYKQGEARKAMEAAGVAFGGNGPLGMATDPDGLRLQLLAVPGGSCEIDHSGDAYLAGRTAVPSGRRRFAGDRGGSERQQTKADGDPSSGVARTRPLCPYPQVGRYQGSGSVDDAANFGCRMP
jgi:hypothetical protein